MGRRLPLAPCGLVVEHMQSEADGLVIFARSASKTAACPACSSASARIHSTYQRSLADLSSLGQAVRIKLSARRVPLRPGDLPPADLHGTARGDSCASVRAPHDASGGHRASSRRGPGRSARAKFCAAPSPARQQGHVAARRSTSCGAAGRGPTRGRRYGTIICDLEQRRIIDLLPDREAATVTAWLAARPSIGVIARARAPGGARRPHGRLPQQNVFA